ncbi:MAG: argininosuccinate lyase [Phycisphaerales bacterium]|nr:MAG: argininosuccinate lyase [Phycisphaerales bacterium]
MHPTFAGINQCLQEDWFLLRHELKLQRAHAGALREAGILTDDDLANLQHGLDAIEREYGTAPCPASDAEDIHTWIESTLTERVGHAGRKIHTGRSRNDQVATLLKMYVIEAGEALSDDLESLIRTSCRRAKDWADLVFPLQTHNQFAAPGSVGFWALRHATAFDRVRRHLRFCVSHWRLRCPLGSGAVAGSSIPIDRRLQAEALGFEHPSRNALDSTTTRDECVELLALAAQVALHLQSFAADVIVFTQTPLGWTVYPRSFATGSSMMPNKSNPDAMELLRGECCAVVTAHGHALTLLKGLPGGYNRDLQCIKPLVHETVEKLTTLCRMAGAFLEQLDFDADRLAASLAQGGIGAALHMERKVLDGLALREAHHAVAAEVQQHGPSAVTADASDAARYRTSGGASPAEVRRIADEIQQELG